jgi:4-hydroxybenzoate polyprenyltransferase
MIQRIQTVYLLLVLCLMVVLMFVPFSSSLLLSIDVGLVAVLAVATIFLYKKRKLQVRIGNFIMLFLVLMYVIFIVTDVEFFAHSPALESGFPYTFMLPFIAGIFDYLAIRSIKKDERLVRSLDRLR